MVVEERKVEAKVSNSSSSSRELLHQALKCNRLHSPHLSLHREEPDHVNQEDPHPKQLNKGHREDQGSMEHNKCHRPKLRSKGHLEDLDRMHHNRCHPKVVLSKDRLEDNLDRMHHNKCHPKVFLRKEDNPEDLSFTLHPQHRQLGSRPVRLQQCRLEEHLTGEEPEEK